MKILTTPLTGAVVLELERREDERGFFARTFCREEFVAAGIDPTVEQCNVAYNREAGTLRGIHFQYGEYAEAKTVRCSRGAIHDVIVDLRPDSPTYLQHFGIRLDEDNRTALHVPRHFGHAYITLTDDVETQYQVSTPYAPGHEGGLRFDDPALRIDWPVPVKLVSPKDAAWPLLAEREGGRP